VPTETKDGPMRVSATKDKAKSLEKWRRSLMGPS